MVDFAKVGGELYRLFYNNLSAAAKCLLRLPQSTWTIDDLEQYAINPRQLSEDRRRGCYMLAAIGVENDQDVVEIYIGSSVGMTKRFGSHLSKIKNLNIVDRQIQPFHRRCRQLGVLEPLFIRLSNEPTFDAPALTFQESACIAIMGTWGAKDIPCNRIAAWKVVRKMRLVNENDNLPKGWCGANRNIPL